MTPFAEWLTTMMRARGLSQAQVARQIGVADAQVSRWRRGSVTPSFGHLDRIAGAFGVPRATLEHLAGYAAAEDAGELDVERQAEMQAAVTELAEILEHKVPRRLWAAYTRGCLALADEMVASFQHALEAAQADTARPIGFRTREE